VAFTAGLSSNLLPATGNDGVWAYRAGQIDAVGFRGAQAVGAPTGVLFSDFSDPRLNSLGRTAFWATVVGNGVTEANNSGIWSEGAGSLALVARSGGHAPGTPSGVVFEFDGNPDNLTAPLFNDTGHVAFSALLTGDGVDDTNDRGVWSNRSGSLELVVRAGSAAPGMATGVRFSSVGPALLSNTDTVGLIGTVTGPGVNTSNNEGLWLDTSGVTALVARTGSHAPGTPAGTVFNSFFQGMNSSAINDAGQVLFRAYLTGAGVNSDNDEGIWATDRSGVLQLIVREGDSLQVAPGDVREIEDLDFLAPSWDYGRPLGFNNKGEVAFQHPFSPMERTAFL